MGRVQIVFWAQSTLALQESHVCHVEPFSCKISGVSKDVDCCDGLEKFMGSWNEILGSLNQERQRLL